MFTYQKAGDHIFLVLGVEDGAGLALEKPEIGSQSGETQVLSQQALGEPVSPGNRQVEASEMVSPGQARAMGKAEGK